VAMSALLLTSCNENELYEEPSWLGNSIYDWLKENGNYSYTLRLIDDLGQTDVLSQTGSKTLFVANDSVYNQLFQTRAWGVGSYDELKTSQKNLLFKSAMINNAYLVELMSNVSGNPPLQGQCMRRETAASVFDSVTRIMPAQMPQTSYWDRYRNKADGIVLLRDNTTKPMIHFLPVFMRFNNITSSDLEILTNGQSRSTTDSWVNGKKIIREDITCKNGYIQQVDGLATAADNMADIVHSHANMSRFASLIDRFCAPYYDNGATKEYNRLYNNEDSVFTLRYFSSTSNTADYPNSEGGELTKDPDGNVVDAYLGFDPGWNQYMYTNTAGRDLHYDAGALLVPTNEALDYWWNNDGKVLQDMYGSWERVPEKVLVKMLDIDFVRSFSETVPSKFKNIVDNTTKLPLGIERQHVDSCFMGCNGVVYLLNRVFTPASYSSVSFPALVNVQTMNIIWYAIEKLEFEPYLNSMDSYYSFIIPTNSAMLTYLDPCTYGQPYPILYEFFYENSTVGAHRYYYDTATGQKKLDMELTDATKEQVDNRLEDLLNNLIVIGNVEDGQTYYRTKGGSMIRVMNAGQAGQMKIEGGYQMETGSQVTVQSIYDQTRNGNGKSYVVEQSIPMTSKRSLYSILNGREGSEQFFDLLTKGGSANTLLKNSMGGSTYMAADYNCSLFDAYNYTVYVPTNAAIEKMISDGYLPTWADYDNLTAEQFGGNATLLRKARTLVANRILNFMKYHIQDNSVMIGSEPVSEAKYETSTLNPLNKRFYSLTVSTNADGLTVKDLMGNQRSVVKGDNYNLIGREYWIQDADKVNRTKLYNASDVVVHQIDGVLLYQQQQLTPWREEVEALKVEN
jgi:hypothetical protein